MSTARPSYPFTVRSADVWRIALPASFAFISEPLVGLTNITVIGRLGDANALGGLVLGSLIFDFLFSLAYFLRLGTAGLTAQAVGARDPHDGLMHAVRAFGVAIVLGVAMIVLSPLILLVATGVLAPQPKVAEVLTQYVYLRVLSAPFSLMNYALLGWFYGRAAATTGMALQLVLHGVNIALSVLFVFGLHWGVPGAAAATMIGQGAAALAGLTLFVRHFGGVRRTLAMVTPAELFDPGAVRRMLGLSRDLMIRSATLMLVYVWFAAQGSRAGEVTLSANAVLENLLMVTAYFLDGIAQAAEQLCGKAVGANWRPAYDKAIGLAFRWGLVIGAALSLIVYFAGPAIIGFMTTNQPVRNYAEQFLLFAALSSLTGMPAFVMDGVLTGSTMNILMRNGMVLAFGLFLVAAAVLPPLLGNSGLWLAMHVFFVARGAIFFAGMLRRRPALFTPQIFTAV